MPHACRHHARTRTQQADQGAWLTHTTSTSGRVAVVTHTTSTSGRVAVVTHTTSRSGRVAVVNVIVGTCMEPVLLGSTWLALGARPCLEAKLPRHQRTYSLLPAAAAAAATAAAMTTRATLLLLPIQLYCYSCYSAPCSPAGLPSR
eukprot:1848214-Prymnesium_polylepis.1